jgi:hypothetical protein
VRREIQKCLDATIEQEVLILMGYYQGDLYKGDFFGSIGRVFSTAKRIAAPVFSALGGAVSHPSAAATGALSHAYGVAKSAGTIMRQVGSQAVKHPVIAAAGVASAAGAAEIMHAAGGGAKMKVAKNGVVSFHRRRRMHPTNAKALRRALRRAYAFERIAMRTIHLLHPRKKGRFGGFRRHRRKAA